MAGKDTPSNNGQEVVRSVSPKLDRETLETIYGQHDWAQRGIVSGFHFCAFCFISAIYDQVKRHGQPGRYSKSAEDMLQRCEETRLLLHPKPLNRVLSVYFDISNPKSIAPKLNTLEQWGIVERTSETKGRAVYVLPFLEVLHRLKDREEWPKRALIDVIRATRDAESDYACNQVLEDLNDREVIRDEGDGTVRILNSTNLLRWIFVEGDLSGMLGKAGEGLQSAAKAALAKAVAESK